MESFHSAPPGLKVIGGTPYVKDAKYSLCRRTMARKNGQRPKTTEI